MHRDLRVRLEPHDRRGVCAEQRADLLGYRGEHDHPARCPAGDQRRHPPQGRLLVGDPAEPGVQLGVVQGDGELAGDELDPVQPFGGERAAEEAVFQQQHRPQRAAAEDGQASSEQQPASAKYGSRAKRSSPVASATTSGSRVRWAYRSTDIGTARSCPVPLTGTVPPSLPGAGSSQSCRSSLHSSRCTPVAPVIALSTWTTRACSRSMLVSELSACDADRMPSRSIVPVVTAERRCRKITGLVAAVCGGRVGWWPQGRVGPVQLGDLRGRAPGEVLLAGLGEQVVAGVLEAVGEVEAGRALGDQRPVPWPLPLARPRAARRRRPGRRRGSRRPPRPARLRPAAAGAGSCPARPRRGRPATGSPRPARTAGRRARQRRLSRACPARASPRSQAGHGGRVVAQGRAGSSGIAAAVCRARSTGSPKMAAAIARGRCARGQAPAGCPRTCRWGSPRRLRLRFRRAGHPPATGSCRATGRSLRCRYAARRPAPPPPRRRSRPALARSPAGRPRSDGRCSPALARSPPAISPSRAR